jgi:hypothetical protein
MCIETTTSHRHCMTVHMHTFVCLTHIMNTRRQIDNAPCSNLKVEVLNSDSTYCMCRDGGACFRFFWNMKGGCGYTWSFEKDGDSLWNPAETREEYEFPVTSSFLTVLTRFRAKARELHELYDTIQSKKKELSLLRCERSEDSTSSKRRHGIPRDLSKLNANTSIRKNNAQESQHQNNRSSFQPSDSACISQQDVDVMADGSSGDYQGRNIKKYVIFPSQV